MMKSKTNKSYIKACLEKYFKNKKSLKTRYFTKTDACYDFRPFY